MKNIVRIITLVDFIKKNESDKVQDHCQLTGEHRGRVHSKRNINVTQKQCSFVPIVFHTFSNYGCQQFFKKLVDKKNDKVKFDKIPKANVEYNSPRHVSIRVFDSY